MVWENDGPIEAVRNAQGGPQLQPLRLRSGDQTITAQGTLAPEGAVAAAVRVQQRHVQSTVRAVVPDAAVPDGRLDLDLTLQGTVAQPQLEGAMALTSVRWQKQSLGEVRATFGLAAQTVRLDLRWDDQGTELLHAQGTLGLGATGALAIQVQAPEVTLHRLAPLSPAVLESAGTLGLDLQLAGTLAQPQVHGHLEVRDGVLQLAAIGERYRDMQIRLLFHGERVEIERWHIGSRSGPLELTGQIEHTSRILRHVELAVRAQEFTALHRTDMQAMFSATIDMRGSLEEMTVTGQVNVPQGRMRLPDKLAGGPAGVELWELTVEGVCGSGPADVSPANDAAPAPQITPSPFYALIYRLTYRATSGCKGPEPPSSCGVRCG
jgi:translocation and assembly module TamB